MSSNQTIKFRVWDTELKEFSNWKNRDPFFCVTHGQIFFWERTRKEDGSYGGDIILKDTGDRFVLQQFTGLLGKGRKEIFDGDIVRILSCYDPEDLQWDIGQIVYNIGAYYIVYNSGSMELLQEYHIDGYADVEVIGNIYENPELLVDER